jgi:hypothetical protein
MHPNVSGSRPIASFTFASTATRNSAGVCPSLARSGIIVIETLPQPDIFEPVNTRTSSLTTVSHAAFNLRFSSLADIESACKEDSARRAVRIIDWISERITRQCSSWVDALDRERSGGSKFAAVKGEDAGAGAGLRVVDEAPPTIPSTSPRTPWWDDVKRCVEGDCVPTRTEGWNHPTSSMCICSFLYTVLLKLVSWPSHYSYIDQCTQSTAVHYHTELSSFRAACVGRPNSFPIYRGYPSRRFTLVA